MSILIKYIEDHKKGVIAGLSTAAAVTVISMVWLGVRKNAYTVSVEGKVIGIIKTKEEAQSAYDQVVSEIDEKVKVPFLMNETLEVDAVHAAKKDITSIEDLQKAILDSVSYKVEAYEIIVDDVSYAVVGTKEEAAKILEDVAARFAPQHGKVQLDVSSEAKAENQPIQQTPGQLDEPSPSTMQETAESSVLETNDARTDYTEDISNVTISNMEKGKEETEDNTVKDAQKIERTLQSYDFNEKVMIKSTFVEEEKILSWEEAEKKLTADRYEVEEYKLVEGDNIWDIAVTYDTTQERILELNPEIEDETVMQIGQVIKVEKAIPILSITTIENATFKELIPGQIQYRPSQQFYEGFTKVIVEGNDGVKELTVEVTKVNGEEVSRRTLSENVLKKQKVTVIAYGVKEKEPEKSTSSSSSSNSSQTTSGSGSSSQSARYIHPLKGAGTISSTYGYRWGSFHNALDYAAPAGTPIYAARAGKVIYSAYNQGGYGKLIIIEHADGTQTYYAHCSSLYVNVGETVSQGERIAGVGTTGNSTGNHLHFEIRINGKPVNPSNYL